MTPLHKPKIVVLGMLSKHPVAGMVWITVQYLIGLERLGYEAYYVEPQGGSSGIDSAQTAAWIDGVMRSFDLGERWAFHALHGDGRCYGLSESRLQQLYQSAALLINLHGSAKALPELCATGRLLYLETDPVEMEIALYENDPTGFQFLEPHFAFFTWGGNYGNPDCRVPLPERFRFRPTRQPVILDLWEPYSNGVNAAFTTIGNWRQPGQVEYQGEVYNWSKHYEYLKFLDLPARTPQKFELALSSYEDEDRRLLESHGWHVRHSMDFSTDLDAYRDYIARSRGEFTVAKDQNVRLRSGWFSERSAQYLASGRPVITQETGFSNVLPTGRGLFGFSTMDDILAAVDSINSDYEGHSRAATDLAREYFNYDVVLRRMLDTIGL